VGVKAVTVPSVCELLSCNWGAMNASNVLVNESVERLR
jgi:hypothetical protein